MREVQHTGRTMSDTRKQRCGAYESMYIHSEQRRNTQSKPCHESTTFTLLPLRPQSHRGTQITSRGSEPLGLQVQGFCCPLQQRPDSGRVKPQSRGGGDGRVMLLSSLSVKMESGTTPTSTVRTQNMTSQGGDPTVSHHKDGINNTAETPKNPCGKERQAHVGPPGTVEVSKLHLYLPSSLCDDEDQDSETDEMRPAPQSDVKPNNLGSSQTQRSAEFSGRCSTADAF